MPDGEPYTAGQRLFNMLQNSQLLATVPSWSELVQSTQEEFETIARDTRFKPWLQRLDNRQQEQIRFSRVYANNFHHGADGHNSMMIIAKLADMLDEV